MSNDVSKGAGTGNWGTGRAMRGQRRNGFYKSPPYERTRPREAHRPLTEAHQQSPSLAGARAEQIVSWPLARTRTALDSATPVMAVVGAALGPALADVPRVT